MHKNKIKKDKKMVLFNSCYAKRVGEGRKKL